MQRDNIPELKVSTHHSGVDQQTPPGWYSWQNSFEPQQKQFTTYKLSDTDKCLTTFAKIPAHFQLKMVNCMTSVSNDY